MVSQNFVIKPNFIHRGDIRTYHDLLMEDAEVRRGHRGGCIPPTRPKEELTWHLISLKIIAKILLHCTLLGKDAKIKLMLTISQKRFFVSLDELAWFMEPDIK